MRTVLSASLIALVLLPNAAAGASWGYVGPGDTGHGLLGVTYGGHRYEMGGHDFYPPAGTKTVSIELVDWSGLDVSFSVCLDRQDDACGSTDTRVFACRALELNVDGYLKLHIQPITAATPQFRPGACTNASSSNPVPTVGRIYVEYFS